MPAYLVISTPLQATGNLVHVPFLGLFHKNYLPQQMSIWQPVLISRSITELSPTTQIKLMPITSTNYAKACEQKLLSLFPRKQKFTLSLRPANSPFWTFPYAEAEK